MSVPLASVICRTPGERALPDRYDKAAPDRRGAKGTVGRGAYLGRVDEPFRPQSFLDGDEAVLDAGAQGEVTILVPQVAHGREDDDEAPGVMVEIGTEAARLGDRFPRRGGRVRLLEHGCDVVVVVKARGQHVVEGLQYNLATSPFLRSTGQITPGGGGKSGLARRSAPRGRGGESTTRRRQRTKAWRVEALDLAGLYVGPLRIGGKSFDDVVQLAGLVQLGSDISPRRNSVRRVFFPSKRTASTSARYSFAVSPRCLTIRFTNTPTSYGAVVQRWWIVSPLYLTADTPFDEQFAQFRSLWRFGKQQVAPNSGLLLASRFGSGRGGAVAVNP